jgi:DNA modification methylase
MTDDVTLYLGDVSQVLPMLEPPYTACFCDPPYGLKFMGKEWDHGVPGAEVWRLVYDLLAPGAVLLAFGGTRTWHRLAVAIEDAGFEVFDTLMWLYGSGFPKSHDISKAVDREAGAEREVVGVSPNWREAKRDNGQSMNPMPNRSMLSLPATPLAETWQGYGTALKPAWEPIIAARKPREATYAQTAIEHGAGALWIDGCRVPMGNETWAKNTSETAPIGKDISRNVLANHSLEEIEKHSHPAGRWPANLLLDEDSAAMLDEQSGTSKSTVSKACGRYKAERYADREAGYWGDRTPDNTYTDSGGASRFFYTAKASRGERGEGNGHPTVKPLALCKYLARLILPPAEYRDDARLLVPFAGSGSEMIGAMQAGWRNVTGIECEPEYVEIAERRLEHWRAQLRLPLAEGVA